MSSNSLPSPATSSTGSLATSRLESTVTVTAAGGWPGGPPGGPPPFIRSILAQCPSDEPGNQWPPPCVRSHLAELTAPANGSSTVTSTSASSILTTSTTTSGNTPAQTADTPTSIMVANNPGGLSLGAKVGLGVAVPIVVFVAALIAFVFIRRRRASRKPDSAIYPELQSQQKLEARPEETNGAAKPFEVDGQSRVEAEEQAVYELSAAERPRELPPPYPSTRSFYHEAEA